MVILKQELDISEEKRYQSVCRDNDPKAYGKSFVCNNEGQLTGLITKTDTMNVVDKEWNLRKH